MLHAGMLVPIPAQGCPYRSPCRDAGTCPVLSPFRDMGTFDSPLAAGSGLLGGSEMKLWSPERAHIPSGQQESRSWPCWRGQLRPTYVNQGYFWPLAWLRFGGAEQFLVPSLSAPLSQGPAGGSKTVPTSGVNGGCSWVCRFWGRSFGITSWSSLEMVLSSLPVSLPAPGISGSSCWRIPPWLPAARCSGFFQFLLVSGQKRSL